MGLYPPVDDDFRSRAESKCEELTGNADYQIVERECSKNNHDMGGHEFLKQTCFSCDAQPGVDILAGCDDGPRDFEEACWILGDDITWDDYVDQVLGGEPGMALIGYHAEENMLCVGEVVE